MIFSLFLEKTKKKGRLIALQIVGRVKGTSLQQAENHCSVIILAQFISYNKRFGK